MAAVLLKIRASVLKMKALLSFETSVTIYTA